jgi:2-methylfumaryl-CoA isomerase
MPTSEALLEGLRVIEVSSFVAAPLGGMTLAQLGADVVRIDPPGGAADQRRWPVTPSGVSLYWAGLNKGKRSITLNLRSAAGRQVVRDLVAACPPRSAVFLTNSVGQEWLSYDSLREVCPDLIHLQVQGHSDGRSAVDYTVNAELGFPMVTGPVGYQQPVNHVLPAWDIACGLYAALGISAAARRRELTGAGEQFTVALHDVALSMAGNLGFLAEAELNGTQRDRIGNHLYGSFARDFGSRDGQRVMVVALTGRHWADLLAITGTAGPIGALEASLGVDFTVEGTRFEYREVLAALIGRWFAGHTYDEVTRALSGATFPWAPYRTFADAVERLHTPAGANPIVSVVDQPGVGTHLVPGSPLVVGRRPTTAAPAPILGQDTYRVLSEQLDMSAEQISSLPDAGVPTVTP